MDENGTIYAVECIRAHPLQYLLGIRDGEESKGEDFGSGLTWNGDDSDAKNTAYDCGVNTGRNGHPFTDDSTLEIHEAPELSNLEKRISQIPDDWERRQSREILAMLKKKLGI